MGRSVYPAGALDIPRSYETWRTFPKIGSGNFAAFRAQAERCFLHAQLADDQETRLRWTSLGETWLAFADKLGLRWPMTASEPPISSHGPTYH